MMNYSFPKQEKVISLKIIESLYSKGNYSVFVFPFKVSMVFVAEQQANYSDYTNKTPIKTY